jgi:hypothetical protein
MLAAMRLQLPDPTMKFGLVTNAIHGRVRSGSLACAFNCNSSSMGLPGQAQGSPFRDMFSIVSLWSCGEVVEAVCLALVIHQDKVKLSQRGNEYGEVQV